MNKKKLDLKLRPFSAIKQSSYISSSKNNKYNPSAVSKKTQGTYGSTRPTTHENNIITDPYESSIPQKGKISMFPNNINEFRHLMTDNNMLGHGELKWTLGLRNYKPGEESKKDKKMKTTVNFHPPSFYEDDLAKYTKKNKPRPFSSTNANYYKLSHLTKNYIQESVNSVQYGFETSLRNFKPKPGTFVNKEEWQELPYTLREPDHPVFLPPYTETTKEAFSKVDKFTLRPYSVRYDQVTVGKDTIKRKKLVKDNNMTIGTFGNHMSLKPYDSKYFDVDTYRNHELLGKHTNSQCLFELCLRARGPIERNKIKRKKKAEMDKEMEEMRKKKMEEYKKMKMKNHN